MLKLILLKASLNSEYAIFTIMIRRKFLRLFSSSLSGFSFIPGFYKIGSAQTSLFSKGKIEIHNLERSGAKQAIEYVDKFDEIYFSLKEFAEANDYGIFTNTSKRKSVIYVGRDKVKFTADNSFVILNGEQIYQFTYRPFWQNGEIWVPATVVAELFDTYTGHKMQLYQDRKQFIIGKKDVNISNISITPKENGTLIHIRAEKQFGKDEVLLKTANGWLHIDVVGGTADSKRLSQKIENDLISEIQVIQLEQMVSLAFKLRKKIVSRELVRNPDLNDLFITLKTSKDVKKTDKTKEDLERQKKEWMIDTIVIDAGHGGKDPGAVGHGRLKEKDIVLPVALRLGKAITKRLPGVKVVYTRDKDVFIPLWKRTKIANQNRGKLFISLHCNANNNKKVNGFETYFLSADKDEKAKDVVLLENKSIEFEEKEDKKRYEGLNFVLATIAQNAFIKQSQYFATTIQNSMAVKLKPLGFKDRGVKQGPFWVMVGATMPNVLIEMGFISNKHESKLLKQKNNQQKIADSICDGIVKYKSDFESSI